MTDASRLHVAMAEISPPTIAPSPRPSDLQAHSIATQASNPDIDKIRDAPASLRGVHVRRIELELFGCLRVAQMFQFCA